MARWLGLVVSGGYVTVVDAEVLTDGPIEVIADNTWPLQKGDRPDAYRLMYDRVANYARENGIARAVIKESALTGSGVKMAHLLSAELRGVVISACASIAHTTVSAKAIISKTFGGRTVDEYVEDDQFWEDELTGKPLRKGSREAAMIIIAARKK